MIYRVKQFFWGLTARLGEEDINLVKTYLNDYEIKLFFLLPRNEQVHSVRVGKRVINEIRKKGIKDNRLVKAALLHDIGKIDSGLNIVSKSIMVILNKLMPRTLSRLVRFKTVNAYYNHPEIAMGYIKDDDEKLRYYILNHHNYTLSDDEKLHIIQIADSDN